MAKVRQHDGDLYVSGNLRVLGGIQNVKNSETVTRLATSEAAITVVEGTLTTAVEDIATITEAETDPNQMTPKQKQGASISWNSLVEYHATIMNDMTKAGVPLSEAAYVNYDSAYDSLYAYLFTTPACLSDLTTTTTIVYVTFSSLWLAEASYRAELQSLIQSWGYIHGIEDAAASSTKVPVPPVVTANIMFNTAYLRWPAQAGLTGEITHRIERSDVSNFASHVDVATIYGNTYTDEGLALNGTDDTPTSRTYYYRVIRIVNATVESNASNIVSAIAASLNPRAIAASAISAAKIAAGAIDMGKMATGIRPPRVVAALPANPYTGYLVGDTVVLTSDNKLYRLTSVSLPTTTGWTKAVDGVDIIADSITAGSIAAGAIGATEIAADAVTASKIVAGARNSPNDPVAYWSMDSVPEIPDDPAGIVVLGINWTNLGAFGLSRCTASYLNGKLILTATGARPILSWVGGAATNKTYRVKFRKLSGMATDFRVYNGITYTPYTPYSESDYTFFDWELGEGATSGALIAGETGSAAEDTYEVEFVYIGTGAYLPNSLIDNSGNGNHGTIYGATPVDGISGKALEFDGVNDHCLLDKTKFTTTGTFSISAFVSGKTRTTEQYIFARDGAATGSRGIRCYLSAANLARFLISVDGAATLILQAPAGTEITSDSFLVFIFIPSVGMYIYKNGVLVASNKTTAPTSAFYSAAQTLSLSGYGSAFISPFDGTIDEPRIYNRALTEAEIKFLYENKVTTTGMIIADQIVTGAITANKIFAGAVTTDKLAAEAVTAVKIDVADLFALDLEVGNTLRTGKRYGTNGAVADATKSGTYQDLDGTLKIGTPVGEFSVNGSTDEAIFKDIPIRSYAGSGVQRRATQLDNDSLDFWDTPDTSPASPEQLRARIGRLGVGPSILMDGEFLANIDSTYGDERVVNASSSDTPAYIQLSSGELRIAYQRVTGGSSGPIEERIWNGTSWGTATAITVASADLPEYIQLSSGELRIAYRRYPVDNYLVERVWNGSAWGGESIINNTASGSGTYIQFSSGELRIAYQRISDGFIVERVWNGSAWGGESIINNTASMQPSYVKLASGEVRVAYRNSGTGYIVERIWNVSTWSSESVVNNAESFSPAYTQYITGELRIAYKRNADGYIEERIWNGTAWGSAIAINSVNSNSPTYTQDSSGELRIAYQRVSDSYIVERTLKRYAQIGAGIIESGSNSNGSWIKYGDGTMEQWGRRSITASITFNGNIGTYGWSFYYGDVASGVSLPEDFITTAYVVTAIAEESYALVTARFGTVYTDKFNLGIATHSNVTQSIAWRAIGRWKA